MRVSSIVPPAAPSSPSPSGASPFSASEQAVSVPSGAAQPPVFQPFGEAAFSEAHLRHVGKCQE